MKRGLILIILILLLISSGCIENANKGIESDVGFTDWMTSLEYQKEFERQNSMKKFPEEVEGRNNNFMNEYRGKFVDYYDGEFSFWTHHGMSHSVYKLKNEQYTNDGFKLIHSQRFVGVLGNVRYQATWVK